MPYRSTPLHKYVIKLFFNDILRTKEMTFWNQISPSFVVKIFFSFKLQYTLCIKIWQEMYLSGDFENHRESPKGTLRSLINAQSLIAVQGGWHYFTKSSMIARALGFSHFLGPRDSKKSKFSHLEIYLWVLEQLTGL